MRNFKRILLDSVVVYGTTGAVLILVAFIASLFHPSGSASIVVMGILGAGIGALICGVLQVILDVARERPLAKKESF